MLVSRISYECKWSLTGFYPTKELGFDVTTAMTGFNSVAFEAYQHHMACVYMLAVILLKNTYLHSMAWGIPHGIC